MGAATTAASNGSVNSALDSYTGIGGSVPLVNMMTGEVIFGGVGSGLYGMLLLVLLAVFIAGLMVGRTPEYLGKKVEAREVKLVADRDARPCRFGARLHRAGARDQVRRAVDLQLRPAGILGDALRLHVAGQQQRLGLRRLHGLRPARTRPATWAPSASRSPTSSAASPCSPAASCRCWRRSRWPARWPPSGSPRSAAGTFRTDTPTFVVLLIGVVVDRRRAHLLPRPAARPDRPGPDPPALLTCAAT